MREGDRRKTIKEKAQPEIHKSAITDHSKRENHINDGLEHGQSHLHWGQLRMLDQGRGGDKKTGPEDVNWDQEGSIQKWSEIEINLLERNIKGQHETPPNSPQNVLKAAHEIEFQENKFWMYCNRSANSKTFNRGQWSRS